MNQSQFNALASLIFNIGPGCKGMRSGLVQLKDGRPSTLLASLNRGAYEEAANQFSAWIIKGATSVTWRLIWAVNVGQAQLQIDFIV